MRRIRVIPTLLLNASGGLVKTAKFRKRTYIGDPINAVKIFNQKSADELVLLDIDATRDNRALNYESIEDIVSEAFMPVAYGGGVSSVDQMSALFRRGIEKIILSSAAHGSPELVQRAADMFGSQSIVVCLDVKKSLFGKNQVRINGGTKSTGIDPKSAAKQAEDNGAGEILVNSISRDGTYTGYDIELLRSISSVVSVPVIACGGARNVDDFYEAVVTANCSAVAAGSIFVYRQEKKGVLISYPDQLALNEFYMKVAL